eukprot:TRINITY_DN3202_c0_g1_i1.p1 TRINITY_DN3202_c0_g1~~TRINITY_DN3202_c0_g1_i1.p1  ORF type:complete len:407 (+),score=91.88 TRINITY_DN3202_c0_g1_i1:84-1223(+)
MEVSLSQSAAFIRNIGSIIGAQLLVQGSQLRNLIEQLKDNDAEESLIQSVSLELASPENISPFLLLPTEIRQLIFGHLEAQDLLQVERTSRALNTESQRCWASLFNRNKCRWDAIENVCRTNSASGLTHTVRLLAAKWLAGEQKEEDAQELASESAPINFKNFVLRQALLNEHLSSLPAHEKDLSDASVRIDHRGKSSYRPSILGNRDKVFRVPIVGDSMPKRLVYSMMHSKDSNFTLSKLYPGVEGLGSGLGFTVNRTQLNLAPMYKYDVTEQARADGKSFFKSSNALVYMVDPKNIAQSKKELFALEKEWITKESPILVLVPTDAAQTTSDVVEMLGLLDTPMRERTWSVHRFSVENLTGVREALHWLTSVLPTASF